MTVLEFPLARNVVRVPIDLIDEDVVRLRSLYGEESMEELRESIEEEGVIQPILIAPKEGGRFELIIGSRRLRAEKLRGSNDITAIVIEPRSPLNYILMALAENIHREQLDPFEEARGFLRLMKEYDLGTMEIASKIRKHHQYVTRRLQLVSLPDEVQASIASGELGIEFATTLARLPSGEIQAYYADKATADKLTRDELSALIKREAIGDPSYRKRRTASVTVSKIYSRVELFVEWLKDLPAETIVRRANSQERASVISALERLEDEIHSLRVQFQGAPAKKSASYGNVGAPRNANEVWPAGDVKKILAADRPSDEELARELGRTVTAIRAMRSRMSAKKRRTG